MAERATPPGRRTSGACAQCLMQKFALGKNPPPTSSPHRGLPPPVPPGPAPFFSAPCDLHRLLSQANNACTRSPSCITLTRPPTHVKYQTTTHPCAETH